METARIPLYLRIGPAYQLTTSSAEAEAWLSGILLSASRCDDGSPSSWWNTAKTDSPLAVLLAVDLAHSPPKTTSTRPLTELLLYASRKSPADALRVFALPLCSHLLSHNVPERPTPPPSPSPDDSSEAAEATFLALDPPQSLQREEIINLPPVVRKRKTVADQFDEAAERRLQARRKGGAGLAAVTASRTASTEMLPSLRHRRSASNNQASLRTRPTSRASSVSSARPPTARESSIPAQSKRSLLATVQSTTEEPAPLEKASLEVKNKEIISKVVLAGMRLYGIVPSKTRKSRSGSTVASPAIDASFAELDIERRNDEEYKLMYHQVYKGTCFAFRQHIAITSLALHTDALRETVDKFLGIHCSDPLLPGSSMENDEKFTPGGRKAFGSEAAPVSGNPFLAAPVSTARASTPCDRRIAVSKGTCTTVHPA